MLECPVQICSVSVNGIITLIKSPVLVIVNGGVYDFKIENWFLLDEVSDFMPTCFYAIEPIPYRLYLTYSNVFSTCGLCVYIGMYNPYPIAFPYGNGMVLHFYQQQESSTTKTVHKVINRGLKAYV